jgi:hypothetical protein
MNETSGMENTVAGSGGVPSNSKIGGDVEKAVTGESEGQGGENQREGSPLTERIRGRKFKIDQTSYTFNSANTEGLYIAIPLVQNDDYPHIVFTEDEVKRLLSGEIINKQIMDSLSLSNNYQITLLEKESKEILETA